MTNNRTAAVAFYSFFYWIGVALALACGFLALARNSALLEYWQGPGIPWSWVAGGVSILAFIAAELCDPGGHSLGERLRAGESAPIAEPEPAREPIHQEV